MEKIIVEVGIKLNKPFRYYHKMLKANGFDLVFKCKTHDLYFSKENNFENLTENQIKNSCVRLRNKKEFNKQKQLLNQGYKLVFNTKKKDYHYSNGKIKSRIQLQIIKDIGLLVYYDNPDYYNFNEDKQRKLLIDELNLYGFDISAEQLGLDKLRSLYFKKEMYSKNQNG